MLNIEIIIPDLATPGSYSLAAVKQVLADPSATAREKILAEEIQCLQQCVISIVDGLAQTKTSVTQTPE